ncbi:MAG: tyrosine-type recombinase/integrase, partial [Candidatus Limnocylindria bacterium]
MKTWQPRLERITSGEDISALRLGDERVDRYLEFVGARGRRNTWLATAFDLKVFFDLVAADPCAVTTAHVLDFIRLQRQPRGGGKVVRLEDGGAGLSVRTVKRRLASVSGLYAYLAACGEIGANPVPRGLATRASARRDGTRGTPLLRAPRTLPRVLSPEEVQALVGALRTRRDRA